MWIDADDFELERPRGPARRRPAASSQTTEAALTHAVGLYRGEFLAEEAYAEWAFTERDRLRDLAGQALHALAEIKEAQGDLEAATAQLQRLAELEEHDLDIQRDLLSMLLRRGRHADAVRRYDLVRRRYRKAFNEEPGFDLADVAAGLNAD